MPRADGLPVPVHYLRPNDKVWTPGTVVFLDTETATISYPDRDVERLRLWCAHLLDRRPHGGAALRDRWGDGDTATEAAQWLTEATRGRESVWCWCHNLSFDLTTTRLPVQLTALGWEVRDAAIGGRSPWMRLGKGKRVLTLVDSFSWLPYALGTIGTAVGKAKQPLPEQLGDRASWAARCRSDVAILEDAITQLLDWWDREQLGRWTISGAGCGWNAYRHKQEIRTVTAPDPLPWEEPRRIRKVALDPILLDVDPELVERDRAAVHGGRRGVWRIGEHAAGPFSDLDFEAAYPTIAQHCALPSGRSHSFDTLPLDHPAISSERWGICARVLVSTDVPRWPVRTRGATWYPVGRFWADLAGPDIAEARALGCLLAIGAGQVHRLGRNMAPWASWCLSVQRGEPDDTPRVAQLAAKSWGRSVLGKWASRGFERVKLGCAPGDGWSYEEAIDHDTGTPGSIVDLAGTRWLVTASATPDNAYPAVLAWVESAVRVRLNRAVEALGPGAVLQCDTDGLIVAERVVGTVAAHGSLIAPPEIPEAGRLAWCLEQLTPLVAPLRLRAKQRFGHVTILGPQHLRRDGVRRYSGLPGLAVETEPGRFTVKLWPKLSWQLAHGTPEGYVRPVTRPVVKGPWPSGWALDDGRVLPVQAEATEAGRTRLLGWNSSGYWRAGHRPAELQHPGLAALL